MKSLGEKIRYYRNLKGWSQEEFAYKLDMSLPAVSKIERDITDVSFSRLKQISKTLNVTVSELVSDDNNTDLKTKVSECIEKCKDLNIEVKLKRELEGKLEPKKKK